MKRVTKVERKFAQRMLRRAVAIAERNNDIMSHQRELWRLMVVASHKPRA